MAKLTPYDGETFYGARIGPERVPFLTPEVCHSTKAGQPYSYVVFSDDSGIRWKIVPTALSKKGVAAFLRLYHRNSYGRRGFHSQRQGVYGTRGGLQELIEYIVKHDTDKGVA